MLRGKCKSRILSHQVWQFLLYQGESTLLALQSHLSANIYTQVLDEPNLNKTFPVVTKETMPCKYCISFGKKIACIIFLICIKLSQNFPSFPACSSLRQPRSCALKLLGNKNKSASLDHQYKQFECCSRLVFLQNKDTLKLFCLKSLGYVWSWCLHRNTRHGNRPGPFLDTLYRFSDLRDGALNLQQHMSI